MLSGMNMKNWLVLRNKKIQVLLLVLLVVAFTVGIAKLFMLRFDKGDIYPPYSSLRTDPLGAKAFHDALALISGCTVIRSYKSLAMIEPEPATLFYLGISDFGVPVTGQEKTTLQHFIKNGGRLVLTFLPQQRPDYWEAECPDQKTETKQAPPGADEPDTDTRSVWKFDICYFDTPAPDGKREIATTAEPAETGRQLGWQALPWHSARYLNPLSPEWKILYKINGKPVMIEKKYGLGSLVISADSYFISNEALLSAPREQLLAYLAGPHQQIIFEEAHFGIRAQTGMAGLLKKYRLGGLIVSIAICMGLFVWKNSSDFPPLQSQPEDESHHYLSTRDYLSGLTSLLRRHIDPKNLLSVCLEARRTSITARRTYTSPADAKIREAQKVIGASRPGGSRFTVLAETYNTICRILSEKAHHE